MVCVSDCSALLVSWNILYAVRPFALCNGSVSSSPRCTFAHAMMRVNSVYLRARFAHVPCVCACVYFVCYTYINCANITLPCFLFSDKNLDNSTPLLINMKEKKSKLLAELLTLCVNSGALIYTYMVYLITII